MSNRANAYLRHQPSRWLRPDAARWVRPDAAKFLKPGSDIADVYPALRAQRDAIWAKEDRALADALAHERAVLDALRQQLAEVKAALARRTAERKYNENQPRVPAGNGRISGRWSDASLGNGDRPRVTITRTNEDSEAIGDGGSGDADFSWPMGSIDFGDIASEIDKLDLFDIKPRASRSGGVQLAGDPPERLPEIVVTPGDTGASGEPGIGHNGGPPLEDPPEIPKIRPKRSKQRTTRQKTISSWIGQAIKARAKVALRMFLAAIRFISWLTPYWARMQTYLDPPKTMDELKRAVATPRAGTEVEHMGEQTAMEKEGYSKEEINSPENLIRIPTLKHYEITGWYQKPNTSFGGLTPRQYLVGKPLDEKLRVKREALIQFKVLKP